MKRSISILAAVICVLTLLAPVAAIAAIDSNPSTLTIIVEYGEEKLSDINVAVCRVADAKEVDNKVVFEATPDFMGAGADFADLTESKNILLAADLNAYATSRGIPRSAELTNAQGSAKFFGLSAGLYLVAQVDSDKSEYIIAPYLVPVPNYIPTQGWENEVVSYPKTEPVKKTFETISISVQKVWIGANTHPGTILVQLYRNNQPHGAAVILSATNYWSKTWDDLNPDDTWTVDEVNVPVGFSKKISGSARTGFIITNTKIPDIPAGPVTSDENNMQLWRRLMAAGVIGLIIVLCVLNSRRRLSRTLSRKKCEENANSCGTY